MTEQRKKVHLLPLLHLLCMLGLAAWWGAYFWQESPSRWLLQHRDPTHVKPPHPPAPSTRHAGRTSCHRPAPPNPHFLCTSAQRLGLLPEQQLCFAPVASATTEAERGLPRSPLTSSDVARAMLATGWRNTTIFG
jgi:hypothetical protein